MTGGTVYRVYGPDGALLYVGATRCLPRRMQQHAAGRPWWHEVDKITVHHFATIDEALKVEAAAIAAESPRYTRTPLATSQLTWNARSAARGEAHAAGRHCQFPPCVTCRARIAATVYSEVTQRDLAADVQALRAEGHGRWRVAHIIERRIGSDARVHGRGITVGIIELIEAGHVTVEPTEVAS